MSPKAPSRGFLSAVRALPRKLADPEVPLRGYLVVIETALYFALALELVLLAYVLGALV